MRSLIYARLALLRLRRNVPALLITVLAVTVATAVLLVLFATSHAIGARGLRASQWELPPGTEVNASTGEPLLNVTTTSINGEPLTVLEVSNGGENATPPLGLSSFPEPGTVLVSPALIEQMQRAELDTDVLAGDIVGVLPQQSLIDPTMLAAVRGWDERELIALPGTVSVAAFPLAPDASAWWQSKVAVHLGLLMLAIGVLVPCAALVGATARLSVARQRTYVAGLRLLGSTRRQAASLIAIEAGLAGLVGSLAGVVVFASLRTPLSYVSVGGARWLVSDITPGISTAFLTVVGVVILCSTSALIASRSALSAPLAVSQGAAATPTRGRWGIAILALSIVLLTLAMAGGATSEFVVGGALVGTLGIMVGVPVVGPASFGWLGRKTAASTGRPAVLLASRAVAADASSAFRPATGLFLAVFLAALANGYVTGNLREGGLDWANGSASLVVSVPGGDPGRAVAFTEAASSLDSDARVVPLWQTSDDRSGLSVVVARCADLVLLELAVLPDCGSTTPVFAADYLTEMPQDVTVGNTTIFVGPDVPRFSESAEMHGLGYDLVVDPAVLASDDLTASQAFRILALTETGAGSDRLAALAAGALPGSTTRVLESELAAANEPVLEARKIVNGVLLVTLLLATASIITAALGRALHRAPTLSRLRAAGTSMSVLTRAMFIETAAVLLFAIAAGVALGLLVAMALVSTLGGVYRPSLALTLCVMGLGVAIPLAATCLASPVMRRASDPQFSAGGFHV